MSEVVRDVGITRSQVAGDPEVRWIDYSDARHELSFEHPSDWTAKRGGSGLLVGVVGPQGPSGFAANLNVIRRVNDVRLSLDDLAGSAIREVRRVLTDASIIDLDPTVVAEASARRLLFSYRQGIYGATGEQWMWLTRDHIWSITTASATEDYHEVADIFGRIVSGLRIGHP